MKILHIINSLSTGGAEKLILETVPEYNSRGLSVDVMLLNGSPSPFLDELQRTGCCKIIVPGTSSPYRFKFIWEIVPQFRKYDLIHVHLFPSNYWAAFAKIISRASVPLVFTEHSTSNRRFRNPVFRVINAVVYRSFTKTVCITDDVKAVVKANTLLRENKLTVIQNGVPIRKYASARALSRHKIHSSLGEDDFLLVQIASFRAAKDQATLIRALLNLPERFKVLLVGEGPGRKEHEKLVEMMDLQGRVYFLGVTSDIPSLLATCDIAVLSSNYEGFGIAAVEAMASGRPLIASDVPGLSEVVGGAGILFPKGDEKTLATEIFRLMNDEIYYGEVAQRCTERAKDYDIDIMVARHIELYKSLVNPNVAG